jgi:cell shape-determining protein MreC
VHKGDPVTGDGGLVGVVSVVDPNVSVVTLITDHTMAVAAQVEDQAGDTGVLVPAVGNPNQLVLQYLPSTAQVKSGQLVVTVGFKAGQLQDLYPPGIPIGQVSNANYTDLANNGEVQVSPVVDLRHLDAVQILTAPRAGTARAQVP